MKTTPAVVASPSANQSDPAKVVIDGTMAGASFGIRQFRIVPGSTRADDRAYVLTTQRSILVYSLSSGARLASIGLNLEGTNGNDEQPASLAVDSKGDVYVMAPTSGLVKLSSSGVELWREPIGQPVRGGVYGFETPGGFRLGVAVDEGTGSFLFDDNGKRLGTNGVFGTTVNVDRTGHHFVATDDRYVRVYGPDGKLLTQFGSSLAANDPGPLHFATLGGAAEVGGTLYLTDDRFGIMSATSDGLFRGVAANNGPIGRLSPFAAVDVFGERVYYVTGDPYAAAQSISAVGRDDLERLVLAPKGQADAHLGFGAGLTSSAREGFVEAEQAPRIDVRFEPWWTSVAGSVTGRYTVRERKQVLAKETVAPKTFSLPRRPSDSTIPLQLPPARPGYYEVEAELVRSGRVLTRECAYYAIGAPGEHFDPAALPPGADFGGPGPARGVALSSMVGQTLWRSGVDWNKLLADPNSTAPLDFSAYDAPFEQASQEAARTGVTFEVQLGKSDDVVARALITSGRWGPRVQELVDHFRSKVHAWEAWNEPNDNFGPAVDYVEKILKPFHTAVKAADPSATVVGGTVLGMDLTYWEAIGKADGFSAMDVLGIHPYTGHNRSFEEQGYPEVFEQFHALLARYGVSDKPIWETEVAWLSDGPGNHYSQADKLIRWLVWAHQIGVQKYTYFTVEGGFGDFSIIGDVLKPAAVAALAYQDKLRDRPYVRMVDSGVPHSYAALFGPPKDRPGAGRMLVSWADDLTVEVRIGYPGASGTWTSTDLMGDHQVLALRDGSAAVTLTGSPQYLELPDGDVPTLRPADGSLFTEDLALATRGATASASTETSHNLASAVIDGVSDAANKPEFPGLSAWAQAPGDPRPTITVTLPPSTIDRVLVSSHSLASVLSAPRDYDVEVRGTGDRWETVARVRGVFVDRRQLVKFAPRSVTAVRITVLSINYGGYAGGLKPSFWPTAKADLEAVEAPWYGPALIYEIEAYGPGA